MFYLFICFMCYDVGGVPAHMCAQAYSPMPVRQVRGWRQISASLAFRLIFETRSLVEPADHHLRQYG